LSPPTDIDRITWDTLRRVRHHRKPCELSLMLVVGQHQRKHDVGENSIGNENNGKSNERRSQFRMAGCHGALHDLVIDAAIRNSDAGCCPCYCRCLRECTESQRCRSQLSASHSRVDRHCREDRGLPNSGTPRRPRAFPRRHSCSGRRLHKHNKACHLFFTSRVCPAAAVSASLPFRVLSHTSR
jgi:hypothetical protein